MDACAFDVCDYVTDGISLDARTKIRIILKIECLLLNTIFQQHITKTRDQKVDIQLDTARENGLKNMIFCAILQWNMEYIVLRVLCF